jgi:hypothetical protein
MSYLSGIRLLIAHALSSIRLNDSIHFSVKRKSRYVKSSINMGLGHFSFKRKSRYVKFSVNQRLFPVVEQPGIPIINNLKVIGESGFSERSHESWPGSHVMFCSGVRSVWPNLSDRYATTHFCPIPCWRQRTNIFSKKYLLRGCEHPKFDEMMGRQTLDINILRFRRKLAGTCKPISVSKRVETSRLQVKTPQQSHSATTPVRLRVKHHNFHLLSSKKTATTMRFITGLSSLLLLTAGHAQAAKTELWGEGKKPYKHELREVTEEAVQRMLREQEVIHHTMKQEYMDIEQWTSWEGEDEPDQQRGRRGTTEEL